MIQGWTALQPSTRERRLWTAALAAGVVSASLLLYGALAMDPRHPVRTWTAFALAIGSVALAVLRRRRTASPRRELRIDRDGSAWLRNARPSGNGAGEQPAQAVFVAPWLITLRAGATLIAVWPDSLPADAFRRLHACVRWTRHDSPTDTRQAGRDHEPTD